MEEEDVVLAFHLKQQKKKEERVNLDILAACAWMSQGSSEKAKCTEYVQIH